MLANIKVINNLLLDNEVPESRYEDILNQLELLGEQIKMFRAIEFNRKDASFTIAPHSKTVLKSKSYCLNSGKASPNSKEQFILRKRPPEIPLYKDIALYTNAAFGIISKHEKQSLLWNLNNNVKFESLPINQQAFLLKMDPMSYLKINNQIKSEVKSQLTKFANAQIPFYNEAINAMSLAKGSAHTYETYAKNIETLVSKIKPIDNVNPIKSDGYDIFTQTLSSGFSETQIIFINTSASPQIITCAAFLDPLRPDVQPIGFDLPEIYEEYEKYKDEILSELDKLLIKLSKKIPRLNVGDHKSIEDNIHDKLDLFFFFLDGGIAWFHTKTRFGKNSEDSENDAFRHALWNALMTRDIGTQKAEEFSENHELPSTQDKGRKMDLHNNRVGREIAERLLKSGDGSIKSFIDEILAHKDALLIDKPTEKWEK
ncbi:MAG: hypothetical protein LBO62_05855 [Endomicrobium sp.]|nr:hypothetical protein [Endomicrobium sp.]